MFLSSRPSASGQQRCIYWPNWKGSKINTKNNTKINVIQLIRLDIKNFFSGSLKCAEVLHQDLTNVQPVSSLFPDISSLFPYISSLFPGCCFCLLFLSVLNALILSITRYKRRLKSAVKVKQIFKPTETLLQLFPVGTFWGF